MMPSSHIFFGFIFSIILSYFFPSIGVLGMIIIFLSSFLIDFDHYLGYAIRKKNFNPIKAYKWNLEITKKLFSMTKKENDQFYTFICLFHGIEVLIILLILGFLVSKYFLFIFIGFSFHLSLDTIHSFIYNYRTDKVFLIYDYFKFKKLKPLNI